MLIECFISKNFDLELICIVNIELQLSLLLADACYSLLFTVDERVIHKSSDLPLIIAAINSNFIIEKSFIIYLNYYLFMVIL